MLKRIPTLKGLNLRDSDINRPPEFAQDCRNVEKNSKGEIVLRWGYDKINSESNIIDLFEYVGSQNDPDRGSLLALIKDDTPGSERYGLYRLNGSVFEEIPKAYNGTFIWSEQTKPVEYNKVLYWNDPSFNVDLWKFDGYSSYRAGVPKPKVTQISATGTSHYFRVLLAYYDPQGNVTYGDYEQFSSNADTITLNFSPISDSYYDGFYNKFAYGVLQSVTSGSNQITVNSGHNYQIGDYVVLGQYNGGYRKPIKIIDRTDTTITFDPIAIGTDTYTVFQTGNANTLNPYDCLEGRWEVQVYRSVNQFTNYERVQNSAVGAWFLTKDDVSAGNLTYGPNLLVSEGGNISLGEVYDDSLVRVLPPKAKYMTLYNEFLVMGNLGSQQPDFGFANLLGNDTRLEDAIVWSDISTLSNGSSIETFLINNIRSVGESSEGAVTALHGNDDNLVVHKEKQSYYLNGDLINNTLRVRRAMTEQVGSASHRSIRNVEGGHLYVSPKGVYLSVGGQRPSELSDLIEPIFTDGALNLGQLDTTNSKTITDFLREKMYIFIPYVTGGGIVLSYDYYHKDWFLHDNIPANKGFQDVGITSTDIYFADSTGLYKRNLNSKKDGTKRTIGYYWTGWFDLDYPSIVKKFNNFILLSIAKKVFTATIKGYCNWDADTVEASNTIDLSESVSSEDTQVLQVQANSVSYRISNESDGSDLHITSYEVEYEPTQTKPKGTV